MDHEIRLTSHQVRVIAGLVGASILKNACLLERCGDHDAQLLGAHLRGLDVEVEILELLKEQSDFVVPGVRGLLDELKRSQAMSMQFEMLAASLKRVSGSAVSTGN